MELSVELDGLGHTNDLWAIGPGHEGEIVAELPTLTDSTRHRPVTLIRAGLALRNELRRSHYDLVLAHGAAAAVVAAVAAPRRPPAIVWQTILGLAERSFSGPDALLWRVVNRRMDALVALTPEMGEEARRLGFRGPVWPLPNARSSARFDTLERSTAMLTLRSELGLEPETPIVGFVGYLVDQKRPTRAIDVLAALSDRHPDVHLVMAGSGPLAGEVAQRADERGVADRVHLLGHRDDVPSLLAGFDVFILTSGDEGVPGVVIEAAMAGCPVVTYRLGGVAEVVLDGVTGRVVDEDIAGEVMAEAASGVLSDEQTARGMSTAARDHAAEFSMSAVARRYEARFRDLVGSDATNDHVP